MRILQVSNQTDLNRILQDIKVDSWGIKIMVPKATNHLIRINSISCIAANILKQEMLSLGGDVAVARDALTGRTKKTDCLLIGNLQPFGLNKLASDLSRTLNNYQKDRFTIDLGRYRLNLGVRSYVMGIINLTPDSFSGDALYKNQRFSLPAPIRKAGRNGNYIIDFIKCLVKDGADIIDVGGESSRPGARVISIKEESSRTIPIIKILSKKLKVPISVDTCKPEIAGLG
jgi:dihydropteroate synthase